VPRSAKLGGSIRRDGDVLVINVDEAPTRRRSALMVVAAAVAIGALVWVGSVLRGDDVTVMSSSVTRTDPFTAEPTSTSAPTDDSIDTTTTLPVPIDDASADSTPVDTTPTTVPTEIAQPDLPAVVTVVPPIAPASPSTTTPTRKKKKKATTTTVAPLPPGFNLPAGFYLPPGYVVPTTAAPVTTAPVPVSDPAPVADVTTP